jgi:hypothetical protein
MPEFPSYTACARYLDFIERQQATHQDRPVVMSTAFIAANTGISEHDQIRIRQVLMLNGRLRLHVIQDRWAYSVEDVHA